MSSRSRSRSPWPVLVALALATPLATPGEQEGFATCLDRRDAAARSCFRNVLAERPPRDFELSALRHKAGQDPATARAAVDALLEHDGSARAVWYDTRGKRVWQVPVGGADDRLEGAARALIAVGRLDEARELVARMRARGDGGWAESTWATLGGGTVEGLDPEPSALRIVSWFERVPDDLEISLFDGDPFRIRSARGRVLLLDFWATWCAPCVKSLPWLQKVHEQLGPEGVTVLAINAEESDLLIRDFLDRLGLELPVGRYDASVDRAFRVRRLPTSILIDREGRIRQRWDGYKEGLERQIAARIRALLSDEEAEPLPDPIATVLAGGGTLEGRWSKNTGGRIEGLQVVAAPDGRPMIAVSRRRSIERLDTDGRSLEELSGERPTGPLRAADLDGDGVPELVSFRRGSLDITLFDGGADEPRILRPPAHVLDLAAVPSTGEGRPGALWIATIQGVYRLDPGSGEATHVWGAQALSVTPAGVSSASDDLLVLEPGGVLRSLRSDGGTSSPRKLDGAGIRLLPAGAAGFGLLPASVVDAVVGRFVPGEGPQAALATEHGQVVLVDVTTGRVLWRARWEGGGPLRLARGDLDGDRRDDLLVASGNELVLLSAAAPPAGAG